MSFQKTLGQPAASLPGDFTSANLRGSVLAGTGALVAGPSGVTAGRFAWIDATGTFAANNGSGQPDGFVHRLFGRAVITSYLDATTNLIPSPSARRCMPALPMARSRSARPARRQVARLKPIGSPCRLAPPASSSR